jgi:hypothetical protein
MRTYYFPKIRVEVSPFGQKWMEEQTKKMNNDEDFECTLFDLASICNDHLVILETIASISSVTKELKKMYKVEYDDKCGPKRSHVADAFKRGLIRFAIRNVPVAFDKPHIVEEPGRSSK